MKAVLKLRQDGQVVEETVDLHVDILDSPKKVELAAKKMLAPRNSNRPSWDPYVTLLSVRMLDRMPK
jgi:hypothetical protein